jgi:hypothetical protein
MKQPNRAPYRRPGRPAVVDRQRATAAGSASCRNRSTVAKAIHPIASAIQHVVANSGGFDPQLVSRFAVASRPVESNSNRQSRPFFIYPAHTSDARVALLSAASILKYPFVSSK